jgi:hypothetical protein
MTLLFGQFFQFYKKSNNRFKFSELPKCVELPTAPNSMKKNQERILGKQILKNDVLHDVFKDVL